MLLGYMPRKRTPPPAWVENASIQEICSVSECIAPGPPDWVDRWVHNDFGFCNSIEEALSLVPPGDEQYAVHAFEILPVRFAKGCRSPLAIDRPLGGQEKLFRPVGPEPLSEEFVPLGYDVASTTHTPFFECSPLSCNNLAASVAVNRYCLVDDLPAAEALAVRFSLEEPEPGDYFVLRVRRRMG